MNQTRLAHQGGLFRFQKPCIPVWFAVSAAQIAFFQKKKNIFKKGLTNPDFYGII
ncbi:MAG: hypothetical protein J6P20_10055 [Oscillospiraceae bacterium]|nr:hypothetical protein [Oscillospiraceae bacterium]